MGPYTPTWPKVYKQKLLAQLRIATLNFTSMDFYRPLAYIAGKSSKMATLGRMALMKPTLLCVFVITSQWSSS